MRRLMVFALAFCGACALYVLCALNLTWALIAAAVCALAGIAAALLGGRHTLAVTLCAFGICAGLLWCGGYQLLRGSHAAEFDGKERQLHALVLDAPSQTSYGYGVLSAVELDGRTYRVMLYLDNGAAEILPGDHIVCTAELRLTPQRPEQNETVYFRSSGVWFTAAVRGTYQVQQPAVRTLRHWPALLCMQLQRKLSAVFPDDVSGFMVALLTGDRAGLDFSTRNALSVSGIYHAVAVSGMHVSILLGMIMTLCGTRRRMAAAIGVPVVIFFVLMTGAQPSAVRAGCMQLLLLLASLVRRENDPFTSLSTALMLLFLLDPWCCYNVGLQLSFSAVAGILLFANRIQTAVQSRGWYRALRTRAGLFGWLIDAMLGSFACTVSSMPFSLPLTAAYFGLVSLVSPLVNVLTLWAVTVCFTGGVLIALAALLVQPLAAGTAWILGWFVRYILAVARAFAALPLAAVYLENAYCTVWCVLLWAAVLFALLSNKTPRLFPTAAGVAGSLIAALLLSWADFHIPAFTFTALDVGQGQCLVYGCKGWTAVIDCGGSRPESAGEDAARFLLCAGEREIDALILTHYDADHAGGAVQLMQRVQVETLYLPATEDESGMKARLIDAATEAGTQVVLLSADMRLDFDGGSAALFAPVASGSSNESGLCVLASAAEYDILVTGDLPAEAEFTLLQTHPALAEVELLVAGHHGARTSTSYALLNRTKPLTVLISVGENDYGHPAEETLERIKAYTGAVYRTDQSGTIMIRGN